jgi:hypothetical protein
VPARLFSPGGGRKSPQEVNNMKRHKLFTVLLLVTGLAALAAEGVQAQINPDLLVRVQTAVEMTDHRIEYAQGLLAACQEEQARFHFSLAVDLQGRAKARLSSAAVNADLEIVMMLTLQARDHANQAIALARCCVEGARIEAQLDRTQELLERARERVENCRVDRARAMLHAAVELQTRARMVFREGRCLVALQLTMQARERALDALRLCGFEERTEDRVQHFLAQTDLLIDRARQVVEEHGGERAQAALALAVDLQARAYAQFREGHFEAALRLSKSARTAAERAIRIAKAGR